MIGLPAGTRVWLAAGVTDMPCRGTTFSPKFPVSGFAVK